MCHTYYYNKDSTRKKYLLISKYLLIVKYSVKNITFTVYFPRNLSVTIRPAYWKPVLH